MEISKCWICGAPANSREHIFKSRDLKRIFDRDGHEFDNLPTHFNESGHSRIPGPKSTTMKYRASICSDCNNSKTARADRAYDRMSDWLAKSHELATGSHIQLRDVFGGSFNEEVQYFLRYCAKSLGCRVAATDVKFPDQFPNPTTGADFAGFKVSICRTHPMRTLPNYDPNTFSNALGKGDLIATFSRSHFEKTGQQKITRAIWWESVGHFQISHWLNIEPDPELGDVLDDQSEVYSIRENDFDLTQMKEATWAWLCKHL